MFQSRASYFSIKLYLILFCKMYANAYAFTFSVCLQVFVGIDHNLVTPGGFFSFPLPSHVSFTVRSLSSDTLVPMLLRPHSGERAGSRRVARNPEIVSEQNSKILDGCASFLELVFPPLLHGHV